MDWWKRLSTPAKWAIIVVTALLLPLAAQQFAKDAGRDAGAERASSETAAPNTFEPFRPLPTIEEQRVSKAHPGWEKIVETEAFSAWLREQPEPVRQLTQSERSEDAIQLLDLYRSSR